MLCKFQGVSKLCYAYHALCGYMLQVLRRIFPVRRGLYEDYVANFWCASSVAIKWSSLLPQAPLMKLTILCTVMAFLPSMAHQIIRPSKKGFIYCLANSSFAFYLFSYQVHEKSVLLPLLPISMLAVQEPEVVFWMPLVSAFSMFPLLVRDGAAHAYAGLLLVYGGLFWPLLQRPQHQEVTGKHLMPLHRLAISFRALLRSRWFAGFFLALCTVLHVARAVYPPPERLPWLYDRLFITLAFSFFVSVALYLNIRQWLAVGDHHGSSRRASSAVTLPAATKKRVNSRS